MYLWNKYNVFIMYLKVIVIIEKSPREKYVSCLFATTPGDPLQVCHGHLPTCIAHEKHGVFHCTDIKNVTELIHHSAL